MRKKYTNIAVPEELAKAMDIFIKSNKLGYRSRAEYAVEAIRTKFILDKLKVKVKRK